LLVAASDDSERTPRMILDRYSPTSIFLMRVSIAIDSIRVAWSPIAICDQSAKGAPAFSRRCSNDKDNAPHESILFRRRTGGHAFHGEHSVKRWGSDA
jgi:hypothetical protein